jgi:uncharacterized protein YfcZ (UPF0381/DUF406 family)
MRFVTHPIRILFACLLIALVTSGAAPVIVKAETETRTADTIDLTGIMRNADGSSIMERKYVTRAEFAQMLVQSSVNTGSSKASKTARLFKDVKTTSPKAAYIQAAVGKGYMSGYLGGKFKPDQAVTLKEAAYGTLTVLGYSKQDFTNRLSGSRFEKFKELGLDKGISGDETDKLTKADCENLFYNLLNAKSKSGEIYATTLGYAVNTEGRIDYQALLEKKTKGPFLAVEGWKKQLSKNVSSYKMFYGSSKVTTKSIMDNSIFYVAEQSNQIWIYDNKIFGSLENVTYVNGKPQELTVAGKSYTVEKPGDIKDIMDNKGIKKGSMITLLLGRDDKVAYILPMLSRVAGGDWRGITGFDVSKGTIYKNGVMISDADVKSTDVIYYVKEFQTVWVYGKTVYGVLSTVTPSTSLPEKITVAGVTYNLDGMPVNTNTLDGEGLSNMTENSWGKRLRENGIEEGDNVMVSFGYDGKIAEINKVSKLSVTLVGYVLDITNQLVKDGNKESIVKQIIHVAETGGTILDLECNDSAIVKGSIVEVSFVNGNTNITKSEAYSTNSISDLSLRKFAADARIIEIKDLNYVKLTPARVKETKWGAGNALYARVNSNGDITDLILNNVTDSFYQYGLVKKVETPDFEKGIYDYQLTLDMGEELKLSPSQVQGDISIGPKAVRFEGNTLKEMKSLLRMRLKYINGKQANSGEGVYQIADDVMVFYYQNGEYFKATFDSLPSSGSYNIDGYMENWQGPIRIIIVTK